MFSKLQICLLLQNNNMNHLCFISILKNSRVKDLNHHNVVQIKEEQEKEEKWAMLLRLKILNMKNKMKSICLACKKLLMKKVYMKIAKENFKKFNSSKKPENLKAPYKKTLLIMTILIKIHLMLMIHTEICSNGDHIINLEVCRNGDHIINLEDNLKDELT